MESLSKQELISTITKQADQIKRYETRLRDVVTAYKGLAKEKEALETSLKALNKTDQQTEEGGGSEDDSLAALTLSLSTLTAEKARMEEAFQADKKVTREKYENQIHTLKEETKSLILQHQAEISNLRAKIAYEIQERDNETANHAAMLKEFQMKFNVERKTKEKLEDKCASSSEAQVSSSELEKRVRDLSSELEAARRRLARAEARTTETPALLLRLQEKMGLLEQRHSVALREEQIKAKRAEESARKAVARQEERAAAMEARLAELSQTVGLYDARQRRDQSLIAQLRDQLHTRALTADRQYDARQRRDRSLIAQLRDQLHTRALTADGKGKISRTHDELSQTVGQYDARQRRDQSLIAQLRDQLHTRALTADQEKPQPTQKSETDNEKLADSEYLQTLIDKIHILKRELLAENEKLGCPIDVAAIFRLDGYEHVHMKCQETLDKLQQEFDIYKRQTKKENTGEQQSESEKAELGLELMTLRETVEEYKVLLMEEKQEKADKIKALEDKLKSDQKYHAETVSELRTRIMCLEKQAITQRERYAALLDETDKLIRARAERSRRVSAEETHGVLPDVTSAPHMLHYAHELARKDLDISQLRKDKHILEGHLRDCQRDSTIEKERYKEVVRNLKEEIERLRRIQSREGANLEYLKNVVMAYLLSADYAGRRHMLNAIAAVLHFTSTERKLVLATL